MELAGGSLLDFLSNAGARRWVITGNCRLVLGSIFWPEFIFDLIASIDRNMNHVFSHEFLQMHYSVWQFSSGSNCSGNLQLEGVLSVVTVVPRFM